MVDGNFGMWRNRFHCKHPFHEDKPKIREGPLSEIDSHLQSMNAWKLAQSPNYDRNVNKFYPYSELPYAGEYNLLKIPISLQNLIEHIDYWGEGRAVTQFGTTGFTDCYNINEKYKLVSKGSDVDRKISNRIPVYSMAECDTSNYIKDRSVKLVTVSNGPISKSCAKDIARIVNYDIGKIVTFGYDKDSEDIKNLEDVLKYTGFIYCASHTVPSILSELTAFDTRRAYINIKDLQEELYRNIADANYDNAVMICRDMKINDNSSAVFNVISKMLQEGYRNVIPFAYQLWLNNEQEIVKKYFPAQIALILNGDKVKIINKKYNLALKLDKDLNSNNTRKAFGGIDDNLNNWKFAALWEDNKLSFKIDTGDGKLSLCISDSKTNGNRHLHGVTYSNNLQCKWSLVPLMSKNNFLLYIVDKQFNQGIKLAVETIKNEERLVVSDDSPVCDQEIYGWDIVPFNKE